MHPTEAIGFDWDEENEGHLARAEPAIQWWEAEEVYFNDPVVMRNKKAGRRTGRWSAARMAAGP